MKGKEEKDEDKIAYLSAALETFEKGAVVGKDVDGLWLGGCSGGGGEGCGGGSGGVCGGHGG